MPNSEIAPISGSNVMDEAARIGKAAKGSTRLIKFRKSEYFLGKDDKLDPSRIFIAFCGDWRRGWRMWSEGQIVDDRVGRVADETDETIKEEQREELGDLDKSHWKRKPDGSPDDPWQFENQIALQDVATGETFLFVTQTVGGKIGVGNLCQRYAREIFATNGRCGLPRVELATAKFDTAKYKGTLRPDFHVIGWEGDGGGARGGGELIDITPSSSGAWDPADDDLLEIR